MGSRLYTDEFKAEAVSQIVERWYSVKKAYERIGVSTHCLYKLLKADPRNPKASATTKLNQELEVENARLKAELRQVQ